jgi:translation elongation factor EF-G
MKRGDEIFVIGAKKKKVTNAEGEIVEVPDIEKVRVDNLYVFNGQYPDGIVEAYAGNIVGIGNLDDFIFKSGTISSQ